MGIVNAKTWTFGHKEVILHQDSLWILSGNTLTRYDGTMSDLMRLYGKPTPGFLVLVNPILET